MPKKAHGRTPVRTKNRQRRPPVTRATNTAVAETEDVAATPLPETLTASTSPGAGVRSAAPGASSARPVRPPAARRTSAARSPVTTVNYHYLRRDITSLSVLAPAMVVLLVIAFFILH